MINMDAHSFPVKSQGAVILRNEEPAIHNRRPPMVDNRSRQSYVEYSGTILSVYGLLVLILRLKYKGKSQTCFDTQSFLIHTSISAFLVNGLTYNMLMYDYQSTPARKQLSPLVYRVIKMVSMVSGIVAHLTILLILIFD